MYMYVYIYKKPKILNKNFADNLTDKQDLIIIFFLFLFFSAHD